MRFVWLREGDFPVKRRSFCETNDLISEEEAKAIIRPHLLMLRGCIEDAIAAVESQEAANPDFFHVYPSGARATLIFWQIVDRVEARFVDLSEDVSVANNRGFLTILVAHKLEIRFKKLGRDRRPRNYPTRNQVNYSLQSRLAGMDEPTRATAGYQLNLDGTLKDILLVCPRGNELEWAFSLPLDDGKVLAHPAATPASDDDNKPIVRPKQA